MGQPLLLDKFARTRGLQNVFFASVAVANGGRRRPKTRQKMERKEVDPPNFINEGYYQESGMRLIPLFSYYSLKALKERFIGWFIPVQSSVSQVMELAEVPPYPEILFELSNSVSSESEFNDGKSKSIQDQLFNETLPLRHEAVVWDGIELRLFG